MHSNLRLKVVAQGVGLALRRKGGPQGRMAGRVEGQGLNINQVESVPAS